MNYALIFAGGVGKRMNSRAKPKQFLEIHGKPVIVHTIEHFNNHPDIDAICVVMVADGVEQMQRLADKYNLDKIKWIVPGGESALDSQFIGLRTIASGDFDDKSVVLIHDGVRPLIDEKTITDCINCVRDKGSAITIAPMNETVVVLDEDETIRDTVKRSDCRLARAPQAFYLQDAIELHERSIAEGCHDFVDSATMFRYYGRSLCVVEGPVENIKVTTPVDFFICRALLDARENSQIYGI